MNHSSMTQKTGKGLVILVLIGMFVQLGVFGYVAISENNRQEDLIQSEKKARKQVITASREGCRRNKRDRADNANGWRIAEAARRRSGDIDIAQRYAKLAASLERRSKINCKKEYP